MSNATHLKKSLTETLKKYGFSRKSSSWFWRNDEIISLINLQKSNYGDQFYINIGISLIALNSVPFPQEHHCHVRSRLDRLISEENIAKLTSIMNFENGVYFEEERSIYLINLLEKYALPLLMECTTPDAIKIAYQSGKLPHHSLIGVTKDYLGIPCTKAIPTPPPTA